MNFREYWDHVGTDNIELVCAEVKSSMRYFRMIRYGIKIPGKIGARKIIDAANKITPGAAPDLAKLLEGVPRATGDKSSGRIQPSAAYLATQGARA